MSRLRFRRRHTLREHSPGVDAPVDPAEDLLAAETEGTELAEPDGAWVDDDVVDDPAADEAIASEPSPTDDGVAAEHELQRLTDPAEAGPPIEAPGWPRPGEFVMSDASLANWSDHEVLAPTRGADPWPDVRAIDATPTQDEPPATEVEAPGGTWSVGEWTDEPQPVADADWHPTDEDPGTWHATPRVSVSADDWTGAEPAATWADETPQIATWTEPEEEWRPQEHVQPWHEPDAGAAAQAWATAEDQHAEVWAPSAPVADTHDEHVTAWTTTGDQDDIAPSAADPRIAELTAAVVALADHVADLSRTVAELRDRLDHAPTDAPADRPARRPTRRTAAKPATPRAATTPKTTRATAAAAKAAPPFKLRVTEERELRAIAARRAAPEALRKRARIILHSAKGVEAGRIAERVGVSVPTVRRWQERFRTERMGTVR